MEIMSFCHADSGRSFVHFESLQSGELSDECYHHVGGDNEKFLIAMPLHAYKSWWRITQLKFLVSRLVEQSMLPSELG